MVLKYRSFHFQPFCVKICLLVNLVKLHWDQIVVSFAGIFKW